MLDHAVAVISADPGYFALDRLVDPTNPETISFQHMPVIGWIVRVFMGDNDYHLEPVCTEAFSSYFRNEVLHPDGRVVRFGEQYWDNLQQFESQARYEFLINIGNKNYMNRRTGLVEHA